MRAFDDYQSFEGKIAVSRISDRGIFMAEIAIRSVETGEVFQFDAPSLKCGVNLADATVSVGGFELMVPIVPPRPLISPTREWPNDWSWETEWQRMANPEARAKW